MPDKGVRLAPLGALAVAAVLALEGCVAARVDWTASRRLEPQFPGTLKVVVNPVPGLSAAFYGGKGNDAAKARRLADVTQWMQADLGRTAFSGDAGPECVLEISLTHFGTRGLHATYSMEGEARLRAGGATLARYPVTGSWTGSLSNTMDNARCEEWAVYSYAQELKTLLARDRDAIAARLASPGARAAAPAAAPAARPVADAAEGRTTIAVSDLSPEGVPASDAAIVADWLRGALVGTGTFAVVERGAMQKVLAEQAFQQTGCTSSECAVKLGKLLNVRRMVVGSFGKFLDSYVLNVRVVDIESGRVVHSDSASGATTKEVEAGIRALATRLTATGR